MSTTPKRRGRPPSATLEQHDPALADLLVDQSLRGISKGASTRVMWRCPDHLDDPLHVYPAAVYNRTNAKNPTGCSICAGKLVVPGINDVATTHPQVVELFVDPEVATTRTAASNKPALFSCADPDHEPWSAPISRITFQGSRCPDCSGRRAVKGVNDLATTHPDLAAQLADPSLAAKLKAGSGYVYWRCVKDPSHEDWNASVYARTAAGTGCPRCSGRVVVPGQTDLATTHPDLAAQLLDPRAGTRISYGSDVVLTWVCAQNPQHTWESTVSGRVAGGCPACANRIVIPGENDLATTHPHLVSQLVDPTLATQVSAGAGKVAQWVCPDDPAHIWPAPMYHRTGASPTGCPECSNRGPSQGESELAAIVAALVAPQEVLTSDQSILPGRHELDIVVPARQLAIEFNGVYWHSEKFGADRNRHTLKARLADRVGYRLVQIWDDDWRDRRAVVIRSLAHKLGASHRLSAVMPEVDPRCAQRLQARKLTPVELDSRSAKAFLEHNHIQGSVTATRHLALQDEHGTPRALLSIRSPRSNSRMNRAPGEWEVQRYATFGTVAGGFTRLLAHAERTLQAEGVELRRWISFSAQDISDGGMYRGAGFVAEANMAPDYRYVGNATSWRRSPKERFQKKRFRTDPTLLWQEGWTEREAAAANGLLRVWDSGKTRWTKNVA